MLRGPRYRWWKPLLSLVLVLALAMPLMLLAAVPVLIAGALAGVDRPVRWLGEELSGDLSGPAGFFYLLLSLAALIPATMWSVWAVHRIRPRFVSSVVGGIRGRWALRCVLVLVPLFVVYLGLSILLGGPAKPPPSQWPLLLALAVLVMPFQAAGEEYLFRGWILQNVGSWFRRPWLGLAVGTATSAALFSVAHGSLNVWVLADLAALAVTACLITWRTGGLEAAVALHAVNNVGVSIVSLGTGTWAESFVDTTTTSTPVVFGISLLVDLAAFGLIWWQASRVGLARRSNPPQQPPVAPPPPQYQPEVAAVLPPSATG